MKALKMLNPPQSCLLKQREYLSSTTNRAIKIAVMMLEMWTSSPADGKRSLALAENIALYLSSPTCLCRK
jgi:hypothetical protein